MAVGANLIKSTSFILPGAQVSPSNPAKTTANPVMTPESRTAPSQIQQATSAMEVPESRWLPKILLDEIQGSSPQPSSGAAASPGRAPVKSDPDEPMTLEEELLLSRMMDENQLSRQEMMDILTSPGKRRVILYQHLDQPAPSARTQASPGAQGGVLIPSGQSIPKRGSAFVFSGRGWGHGVGLSQYGAMSMAQNGWDAERIITHYFPGTSVRTAL
jgi:SpoIID/LytB domain protein